MRHNDFRVKPLYTIGHSSLEIDVFLDLLRLHQVEMVADVRSRPFSARYPQFSQPGFEALLREGGIAYASFGEDLGGRPDDVSVYAGGRVDYALRRKSSAFQQGLERLVLRLEDKTVAMMCAEEDPLECHRFLMNCAELMQWGIAARHIRKGGRIEEQTEAEDRLLETHGSSAVARGGLFYTPADRAAALEDAYRKQAAEFAFRPERPVELGWEFGA